MTYKRKQLVVLLEVIISVALLAAIISALLGYYRYVSILERQSEQVRQESFRKRLVHGRLQQVLSRLVASEGTLFTEDIGGQWGAGQSLVFSYDNGAVFDPRFSGEVIGRLYVEPPGLRQGQEGGTLCLATWPKLKQAPDAGVVVMTHERLLDDVRDLSFEFYFPYREQTEGFSDEITLRLARAEEQKDIPAFITVVVQETEQDAPVRYSVPIPAAKPLIRYPSE